MTAPGLPPEIATTRVVAIMRGLGPGRALEVTGVLQGAGIEVVEITMDSPDAAISIAEAGEVGAAVGAGTVRSIAEAHAAVEAGAQFLVSPHTDFRIASWASAHGVPLIPGAMTPTEVVSAWNAEAAAVKIFPASTVGPGFLAAVRGPLGDIPLIPTGGITADNAGPYLAAGAAAVGIGSWLTGHADISVVAQRATAVIAVGRGAPPEAV